MFIICSYRAVDTTHMFLNSLVNTTEESSLKVRIARLWDNFHINKKNELLGIDMVLIDEEVSMCVLYSYKI